MNPNINLSGSVTFNGATLTVGDVKLTVEHCERDGIAFTFTPQYGLLLLQEVTKVEAQQFLKELNDLPLSDNARRDLIHQACEKGFKMAQLELERYRHFTPTDTPKFYAETGYSKQLDRRVVSLVSTEKTLRFYVAADMNTTISQLPCNVYRFCTVYTGFSLTEEKYQKVLGKEKEFFVFIEELDRFVNYVRGDACNVCYTKYFENPDQAYGLLGEIRDKVSSRESRDKLFQTLERNSLLEFSLGLFVRSGWFTFYVSNDGDVHRLCYNKRVELREAIQKAYAKGKLPTKMEEVTDSDTLKRIAEAVGKIRPELTLLILP